ncbi:MAG: hypothetical protein JWO06_2783 [Bacteroidota bacterium]|nr:hypothetical protein [Bacteroidota bacterium]
MIDYSNAHIRKVSVHEVGNRTNGEELHLSKTLLDTSDAGLRELLMQFFMKPFSEPEYYNLTFSNGDFNLNPVFSFAAQIFDEEKQFHRNTVNLAKHLYEQSVHPQIKPGDLFVAYISDVTVDDEVTDAIGIFKSENRQSFLKVDKAGEEFVINYDDGINIEKLDKGCLIFNTAREEGFQVCIIDKASKSAEALYWKETFLCLKPRSDQYHQTKQFMSLCKNYIQDKLPEQFEVNRTDQIDLMNKSVSFFKANDQFDYKEFTREVIQEPHIIKSFGKYKDEFEKQNSLKLEDDFEISSSAVKSQSRVFKSVLKLDKNFHVYVHGDRALIERGYDQDKGMNFYKIFFKDEK